MSPGSSLLEVRRRQRRWAKGRVLPTRWWPREAPTWEVRPNTGNGYGRPRPLGSNSDVAIAINKYPGDSRVDDLGTRKGVDNGMRVADINGDGRDNLVLFRPENGGALHSSGYLYSTQPVRVMYSNGYNYDMPVALPSHGGERLWREYEHPTCQVNCQDNQVRFAMSAIGDFDGNGIADIAEFISFTRTAQRHSAIGEVVDLFAAFARRRETGWCQRPRSPGDQCADHHLRQHVVRNVRPRACRTRRPTPMSPTSVRPVSGGASTPRAA